MKRLLLLLLLPIYTMAQVEPVISKDYLEMIRKDSLYNQYIAAGDTMNSMSRIRYKPLSTYYGNDISKIVISGDRIDIVSVASKVLRITGSFTTSAAVKQANQAPDLQNSYAQGRSANGSLVWRGPETNEPFSYGPLLNTLEYDNTTYPYDNNGRLVPAGAGSGRKAQAYDNTILRTGSFLLHSFNTQAKYWMRGQPVLSATLKWAQGKEALILPGNRNNTSSFNTSLEAIIKKLTFSGSYTHQYDRFSNSNRNGFLNRLYQQSLLTPISFSNSQGTTIGTQQRSFSNTNDNPLFLLEDNGNRYGIRQQTGSFGIERRFNHFRFKVLHSVEYIRQSSREALKPGAAYFPGGIATDRQKNDNNQVLRADLQHDHQIDDDADLRGTARLHYTYSSNQTNTRYTPGQSYHYQRAAHDLNATYSLLYDPSYNAFNAGLNLSNRFYASNTTTKDQFFLPGISGFIWLNNLFDSDIDIKLTGAWNRLNSELHIGQSFAGNNLLQYSTQQALQYWPVTEVPGFEQLDPVRHEEWTARMEVYLFNNRLSVFGYLFNRLSKDDIFAVYRNGSFGLANLASQRNKGIEAGATAFIVNHSFFRFNTTVSFFSNRNTITAVKDGYAGIPIAGFSDVYKGLVQGQSAGALMGSHYQCDAQGNKLIGSDGFPLVSNTPAIIGDAIPDFTIKMSHAFSWKQLTLDMDWEWQQGGQLWNGTQAVLDYYGRSAITASQRNITGYVFDGIDPNGHANKTPVAFYDPSLPVNRNRWVRYGYGGVAEDHIQRADYIRINNISLSYRIPMKKVLQSIQASLYAGNIIVWTPYKGDPTQLLYDQSTAAGLDFFNLPSLKNVGASLSLQF